MKELDELGLTWGKAQPNAQGWVATYMMTVAYSVCPRQDKEDEWLLACGYWWQPDDHHILVTYMNLSTL